MVGASRTDVPSSKLKLLFSGEQPGAFSLKLGNKHYSYRVVEERFAQAFSRFGNEPVSVPYPESIKQRESLETLVGGRAEDTVHIAFRSTENLRPLPMVKNICQFAWEFDVLKDRSLVSESITANQAHMLRLFDEIWVPCRYTREVLRRYELPEVHLVPTPICATPPVRLGFDDALELIGAVPSVPFLLTGTATLELAAQAMSPNIVALRRHKALAERAMGREHRVFLTICNPSDLRKNLLNLIEGFQLAAGESDRDILIVKLIVPNRGDFRATSLHEYLPRLYFGPVSLFDPRVVFIFDYLNDHQMSALYSLADFYVSASHCEGLNLPLLEAMSHGVLAIATRNTAMRDYLDADSGIIIDEAAYLGLIPHMAGDVAGAPYEVSVATRFDIARAIHRALDCTSSEQGLLAERGRKYVVENYSEESVIRTANARLAALRYASGYENVI